MAAVKFLQNLDLCGYQLLNSVLQNLAAVPETNVKAGRLYWNTTDKKMYVYNGTSWVTFGTSTDVSGLATRISTLEGYFTSGKANNADKLDGNDSSYFATAANLTNAVTNITTLQGYFTSGVAKQAAKVTNALSFTAGAFTDPGDFNGSAAMTLKVPTTTAHITESGNLYFTNARAQAAITGGASTIVTANLTASRVLVSDANGKVAVSAVTSTELGYLDGVTSAIQTQLNTLDNKFANYLPLAGGTMTGTITFGASGKSITAAGVADLAATTLASLTVSGTSTLTGAATLKSTLSVTGASTLTGKLTANGGLAVSGAATFSNAVTVGGTLTANGNILLKNNSAIYGVANEAATTDTYTGNLNLFNFTDKNKLVIGYGLTQTDVEIAAKRLVIGGVAIVWDSDNTALRFEDADNPDTEVATIYATGGVSAMGVGLTGGTGGGLIQTVYGSGDLSTSSSAFDDADLTSTFNAYTINLINGKTNVLGTQLTGLTNRVASLESYFSTAGDSDDLINKWNEITAFLNGVAETDNLTSLLAAKVDNVTVTGSGNAVTTASISGSKLTLTKGATFLTSHQSIYNLDIKTLAGSTTTTVATFDPNAAANSITLVQGSGITLTPDATNKKITIAATYSYSLPLATSSTRGGIKIGYTASGANVPVALSNEQAYVAITKSAVTTALGFTPATSSAGVKRYSGTASFSATDTSKTVTHNLNSQNVQVAIYDSDNNQVFMDVQATSVNTVTLTIGSALGAATNFKVVILA